MTHHLWLHFGRLFITILLFECGMLTRLFACIFQLLLHNCLIVGHLCQFDRFAVRQIIARLFQATLFCVQRFACFAQLCHFLLVVFQFAGECIIMICQPLFVVDLQLAIVIVDNVLGRKWWCRLHVHHQHWNATAVGLGTGIRRTWK